MSQMRLSRVVVNIRTRFGMSRWSWALAVWCSGALSCFSQPKAEPRHQLIDPPQGEKRARALIAEMLTQKPEENSTQTGVLKIRDAKGEEKEVPVRIEIITTPTNWMSIYQ